MTTMTTQARGASWPAWRLQLDALGTALVVIAIALATAYGAGEAPAAFSFALKASGAAVLALYAFRAGHAPLAAALALSALGDAFLDLEPVQMTAGIAAFGAAHLCYIAIFAARSFRIGVRWAGLPVAAVVIAFGAGMLIWLGPDMGDLQVPATVYNGIIIVMAALAMITRGHWLVALGAVLFVTSDALLAMRLFKGLFEDAGLAVWITYFAAQTCLALGIAARARGEES